MTMGLLGDCPDEQGVLLSYAAASHRVLCPQTQSCTAAQLWGLHWDWEQWVPKERQSTPVRAIGSPAANSTTRFWEGPKGGGAVANWNHCSSCSPPPR